jgi:hypothetical protein
MAAPSRLENWRISWHKNVSTSTRRRSRSLVTAERGVNATSAFALSHQHQRLVIARAGAA